MKRYICRILTLLAVCVVALSMMVATAEQNISTTVVMRVSHMTQNAVVDAGEDLSMEVNIEGVVPASYQWYFEGQQITGANQKVYSIVDAKVEDSGVYRMDAFNENGNLIVSMDISARVLDKTVPKAYDPSLAIEWVVAAMAIAGAGLLVAARKRAIA